MRYGHKPILYKSLPITVKLRDVENQTNTILNGLNMNNDSIEDDDIELYLELYQ
jgi:hypothetical protein